MPPPGTQPRKPTDPSTNERNEYIPSFIAKKPFYAVDSLDPSAQSNDPASDDYLKHQRLLHKDDSTSSLATAKWYDRGRKAGPAATKFRKGACENCGSMSHKTKECLSRPRKTGARYTGRDIEADYGSGEVKLGWDAKRDWWNGFDASTYQAKVVGGDDQGEDEDKGGEGDKYEEETDMGRQQSTSTRNLRLREDTAKYLLNLDLDSAKYDPKTRSMVAGGDNAAALEEDDEFMRASGDASEFERAQRYAWETQERGDKNKIHLQANPTAGAIQHKKQTEEKKQKTEAQRKALLEKYGGQEHLQNKLKDMAVEGNERFVEYDARGKIKGEPQKEEKSMYPEDVLTNNHTSVWGSWWKDFTWGYACCHSTVKNSYCTGEANKRALEEANSLRSADDADAFEKAAVQRQEAAADNKVKGDDRARKRTLGEMRDGVTEEDKEEWRKKRTAANDPMAAHLGRDQLV